MSTIIDESFLDVLKDDKLSEPNKRLLAEIKLYYRNIILTSKTKKLPIHDNIMFTLIYNLVLLGYLIEPVLMLSLIDPLYYRDHLYNDTKNAVDKLQQAEDIKNKVDAASKQKEANLRAEGEFVLVVQGMCNFLLKQVGVFPGQEEFLLFIEHLRANPLFITKRPVIGLVK